MRQLSVWGRSHKNAARAIIVISLVITTILGIYSGGMLRQLDVNLGELSLFTFITIYLATILYYPFHFQKGIKFTKAGFFRRQKTCDILLVASTFLMLVYLGNNRGVIPFKGSLHASIPTPAAPFSDSGVIKYKTINAFAASLKDENGKTLKLKEKRKLLKAQLKAIKKGPELTTTQKVLLTVLSVLAALGLLYLVAALACSISCGGSEAAAIIVAIGGAGLVIFLLVVVIRAIYRKTKKEKKVSETPETNM